MISVGLIPIAALLVVQWFFPTIGFEMYTDLRYKYIMGCEYRDESGKHIIVDGSGWNKSGMIRFQKAFLRAHPEYKDNTVLWVKVQETEEVVWTSE